MKNSFLVLFVIAMFTSCTTGGVETEIIKIENSIQKTAAPIPYSEIVAIEFKSGLGENRMKEIREAFFLDCDADSPIVVCGELLTIQMYDSVPERSHQEYWLVTYCSGQSNSNSNCGGGITQLEDDIDPF